MGTSEFTNRSTNLPTKYKEMMKWTVSGVDWVRVQNMDIYVNRNTFFFLRRQRQHMQCDEEGIGCVCRFCLFCLGSLSLSPPWCATKNGMVAQRQRLWPPLIDFLVFYYFFIGVFLLAQSEALFVWFVLQLFQPS